jgi:cold shock CspA family protein
MSNPSLLGQVSFFNHKRGFGRLRSEVHPEGVFVHFSAIDGASRVLIPHELVRYEARVTPRGPRAERVQRLSPRLSGRLIYVQDGVGAIRALSEGKHYRFSASDWLRATSYPLEAGAAVEFSQFEQEAKEVVVTDPRPALLRFAELTSWPTAVSRLEKTLLPEAWAGRGPEEDRDRLTEYLFGTFQRLQDEVKVEETYDEAGKPLAAFHTGLHQPDGEAVMALFTENQQPYAHKRYLPRPHWQLSGFVPASHPLLRHFSTMPSRACYHHSPGAMVLDPERPVLVSPDEILGQHIDRFPEAFQPLSPQAQQRTLREALAEMQWQLLRNPQLAQPVFHRDTLRLMVPLRLRAPEAVLLGLLLQPGANVYRAEEVIRAEAAWRAARLLAPPAYPWGSPEGYYPPLRVAAPSTSFSS